MVHDVTESRGLNLLKSASKQLKVHEGRNMKIHHSNEKKSKKKIWVYCLGANMSLLT